MPSFTQQDSPQNLIAQASGIAQWGQTQFRCAVGRGGIVLPEAKAEGDGASPAGVWPLRRVLYRADRLPRPETVLPCAALGPDDGWCDAVGDPNYNRFVRHPYPASAERLWRDDQVYDMIVVLGYNDDPVRPAKGSAIFLHIATPAFTPTAGCVALGQDDLLTVLRGVRPGSCVEILAL